MNARLHRKTFAAFPKQNDKFPTNARGGGWARLELTEPLAIAITSIIMLLKKKDLPLSIVVRPTCTFSKLCSSTVEINYNEIQTSIIDVNDKVF